MDNNYGFLVTGHMVQDLGLQGSELLIYAYLASCNGWHEAGTRDIALKTGVSQRTAMRTLSSLCDKGLIDRREWRDDYGVMYVHYMVRG